MKRLTRSAVLALCAAIAATAAFAAPQSAKKKAPPPRRAVVAKKPPAAPADTPYRKTPFVGAIAADAATGDVLFSDHADDIAYPASVTKLMTALLVLEDVKARRYSLDTLVEVSPEIAYSEASWMGLKAGQRVRVDHLLMAMLVNSANDAAIALAAHANGSHAAFVERMNARAQMLDMAKTRYFNANGLPPNASRRYPWKEYNRTTAADQLRLAREILKNHSEILKYTSIKVRNAAETPLVDGAGKPYPLKNHNHNLVLDKFKVVNPDGTEAVDGLKTGYIDAGGSSIVLTGTRRGKRAIVVVLGAQSAELRDTNAARLLSGALGALAW